MGLEIERKFLVTGAFPKDPAAKSMVQGYIAREAGRTARVRYNGEDYRLTIKGPSAGIGRQEFEWVISADDGKALLFDVCQTRIEKTRHRVPFEGFIWEVDVFSGENTGLIMAEIELPSVDTHFDKPIWVGPEVSQDPRYYNAALLDNPFSDWCPSLDQAIAWAQSA